jgi:hypothetical protein
MAYTYSGDPSASELDQYRFLVGDTGEVEADATPIEDATPTTGFILSDEEIQFIINTYTSHNARMYYLFNSLANIVAKSYKRALGPQSEDPTSRTEYFAQMAKEYKAKLGASNLSVPVYQTEKAFWKGMFDNV